MARGKGEQLGTGVLSPHTDTARVGDVEKASGMIFTSRRHLTSIYF